MPYQKKESSRPATNPLRTVLLDRRGIGRIVQRSMFGRINQLSRVAALALAAATFTAGPVISSAYAKCCRRAIRIAKAVRPLSEGTSTRGLLNKDAVPDESDSPSTQDGLQLVARSATGKSTQIDNCEFGSILAPFARATLALQPLHGAVMLDADREGLPPGLRSYDATAPPLV